MHELGVTQSLLEIALHHGQQAGATRINELNLVVGELSSIVDDSVQFYWDMISQGTMAEGARLNFKRVPAELHCHDCDHRFPLNHQEYICPKCGSANLTVAGGEEFFLESIDVDLDQP